MKNYLRFIFILGFITLSIMKVNAQSVFINEIHYDNLSTDAGEAVEIAGPAGTDLTGWIIQPYNGNGGGTYTPIGNLSGVIPDLDNGYGVISVAISGLQNGAPDGLALVDASNNVVQFLSYEGTLTATNGPANGMTSTDIGVSESGSGAVGNSLQLAGTGTVYADFTWQAEAPNTFDAVNTGQVFSVVVSPIPTQPTNLTAVNTTQTTTDLSWNASTDDVAVVEYQIFDGTTLLGSTAGTNFPVTGLTPATDYTFKVIAVDGDANTSAAAEVIITTLSEVVVPFANVFINEIHYDNVGADIDETIEVAGTAGTDLSGWKLVLYNGNGGAVYNTTLLSGTIPDQDAGYGTLSFAIAGIQNGAPDGIALIDASNNVMQFLSYEGSFVAVGGAADGMTSEDIGISEASDAAVGSSLQLVGFGSGYADFTWQSAEATFGNVNTDQYFSYRVFVNEIHYDNDGGDTEEGIEVAGPAGTDLTGWSLLLYNGNGGAVYGTVNLSGLIPDQDNGYGTVAFAIPGIQNGAPDGLALVEPEGSVVQFLSYEGTMTGVGGPADGMESEDIGAVEGGSTPVGYSLQLTGTGTKYVDFVWSTPMTNTFGAVNTNQSFGGVTPPPLDQLISIAQARAAAVGTTVTITGTLTVSDQFAGAAYMQDSTAGIAVYDAQVHGTGLFNIGDSITITGSLVNYNGLLEISSLSSVNAHGPAASPVQPKVITLAEMYLYPSELVQVVDASFPTPGDLLFGNSNFILTDGSGTGEMRLDADVSDLVGLAQPELCSVTGVVSQYNDIYQLMPRIKSDLPCATEFTTEDGLGISKDATLDIAAWNIEWFGDSGTNSPADDQIQKDSVKAVLLALDADIIGVEEVSDAALLAQMVSEMPGYDFVLSNATSYPGDKDVDAQKIGFIYKTESVSPVSTKVLLASIHPYYNGGDASMLSDYPVSDPSRFYASGRLPFMMTADVSISGITQRISFIALHARANSSDALNVYNMRKYDLEVLKDTLDAQYSTDQIIMVGDYNDDVDFTVADVSTTVSTYQAYNDDAANYEFPTRALSDAGFRSYVFSENMIDHVMLTNELFDNYIDGSAKVHYEFYSSNYTNTTSDHFPVSVRLQIQPLTLLSISSTEIDCASGNNGSATVEIEGGIAPYTFLWSDGQTTATAENFSAGMYSVTVTDALNKHVSAEVQLTDPDPIEIELSGDQIVYPAYSDSACATISVVDVNGGTGDYTYEWSTGENTESIEVCPSEETVYTLTVRDENGCEATAQVTVRTVDVFCTTGNGMDKLMVCFHGKTKCVAYPAIDELLRNGATLGACSEEEVPQVNLTDFVVYPNPFVKKVTLTFTSDEKTDGTLDIISEAGVSVHTRNLAIHDGYNKVELNLSSLLAGTYVVVISGNNLMPLTQTIIKQ